MSDADRGAEAVALVEDDVIEALSKSFPARDGGGFTLAAPSQRPEDVLANGNCTAVAWEYVGQHERPFAGIDPTHHTVTFRAVTVVDHAAKPPTLARYIDWLSVMHQLGVSAVGRPRVTAGFRPRNIDLSEE